ncbi:DNA-binding MarR family transcriptional regulator [Oxalobacteraceae bacterium GrIS 1.11]
MSTQATALELCLRLARTHALLAASLDERLGTLHGIGFGDFQLLRQLSQAPQRRLHRDELGGTLALSPAGLTRALLPLEKIGLLTRQQDAASLTPAGQAMLPAALETAQLICRRMLEKAPDERALVAALEQLPDLT